MIQDIASVLVLMLWACGMILAGYAIWCRHHDSHIGPHVNPYTGRMDI